MKKTVVVANVDTAAPEPEVVREEGRKKGVHQRYDRNVALKKVNVQKEWILARIRSGEVGRAWAGVADLEAFQLALGGAQYLVKSLCDLASAAKDMGLSQLQLQLVEKALQYDPADLWSLLQYAHGLLNNDRLAEALQVYERAINQHPGQVVAQTGRAEVLKAQGKLAEALAAFDGVIGTWPDNVVAQTGRAEVLKAQGRSWTTRWPRLMG